MRSSGGGGGGSISLFAAVCGVDLRGADGARPSSGVLLDVRGQDQASSFWRRQWPGGGYFSPVWIGCDFTTKFSLGRQRRLTPSRNKRCLGVLMVVVLPVIVGIVT